MHPITHPTSESNDSSPDLNSKFIVKRDSYGNLLVPNPLYLPPCVLNILLSKVDSQ